MVSWKLCTCLRGLADVNSSFIQDVVAGVYNGSDLTCLDVAKSARTAAAATEVRFPATGPGCVGAVDWAHGHVMIMVARLQARFGNKQLG